MAPPVIRIQSEPFSISAELDALTAGDSSLGAVVSFTGRVRDLTDKNGLIAMELEHYPGMTQRALETIAEEAGGRFGVNRLLIIHRVGRLTLGEDIVLVAAASAHRDAAFDAARYVMDYLKTDAPFWKKEVTQDGSRWVDARETDALARARWAPEKS